MFDVRLTTGASDRIGKVEFKQDGQDRQDKEERMKEEG
jgi:hypothetical protein